MPQCRESGNFGRQFLNDAAAGYRLAEEIVARMNHLGWSERDTFAVHLAFSEGIANAIEHGNQNDPQRFVQVEATVDKHRVWMRIMDEGTGFNPNTLPDCTSAAQVSEPHGRGVLLMRQLMDSVTFNERGNDVQLEKRRKHA